MTEQYPIVLLLIAGLSAYLTHQCLEDQAAFDRYSFKPRQILANKEFYRMITSGFIHVDWIHFLFNFMTLYSFGKSIEVICGPAVFIAIYFGSIVGGNLLCLWVHRHHEYTAVGASGGVCGILYASILMFDSDVRSMFLPFWIPGYVYAVLYLVGSYYALRHKRDNVGHDAHIGGSIVGMLVTVMIFPVILRVHPVLFASILIISFGILYFLIVDPHWIKPWAFASFKKQHLSNVRYHRYDEKNKSIKADQEIDALLEKISKNGFGSLTEKEKDRLKKLSSEKNK